MLNNVVQVCSFWVQNQLIQCQVQSNRRLLLFQERVLKILEKEVWPFDEVPEEKPVTAYDEAKAEFSDRRKDYRFLASILKEGNEAAD